MTVSAQQKVLVVELRKCLACRSCEMACAKAHAGVEDIVEAILAELPLVPRTRVMDADGRNVPIQCRHCEDAPCVTVCPSGALYKDEQTGRTLTAPEKCIGCKACVVVCPFGAVVWNDRVHRIIKCDLCEGITGEGEEPRCVTACPTHARRVVRLEELVKHRQKEVAERTIVASEAYQGAKNQEG